MMNSTPLNALNRNEEQDPNTRQMVENIVNEIDDGAAGLPPGDPRGGGFNPQQQFEGMHGDPRGMDGGMGGGMGAYDDFQGGMDYGPPPPQQMMGPGGPSGGGMPHHDGGAQGPRGGGGGLPAGMMSPESFGMMTKNKGMMENLTNLAKDPLLVAALFFVLSNSTVASTIEGFLPYAYSGPLIGLGLRALIAGALFFVLKTFVMKN